MVIGPGTPVIFIKTGEKAIEMPPIIKAIYDFFKFVKLLKLKLQM